MYVVIYAYMHAYMGAYMHACKYISRHICMYVVIYAYMQAYMGVHMEPHLGMRVWCFVCWEQTFGVKNIGAGEKEEEWGGKCVDRIHSEPK